MRKLPTEILVFRIEPTSYDEGDDDLSNQPDDVDSDSGNSND
jgi:hypothetical protein